MIMADCTIVSWNTRGLNSSVKRSLVFQFLKTYHPQICILQETHLTGSKLLSLRRPWVGHQYHSTYTNYSRGVSILIHKSLPFKLLALELDPEGRFVILHAMVDRLELVVVGLYLPPLASTRLLNQLVSKIATYATDNVVILGDFNLAPDPGVDRLSPGAGSSSELLSWAEASNLTDVWRWRNPSRRAYTCHSASPKTLSSIDLAYAGESVLPRVRDITILPRGISDHAPLALKLCVSYSPGENLWRLSRFWLDDSRISEPYRAEAAQYWRDLDHSVSLTTSWDTFKIFTRYKL